MVYGAFRSFVNIGLVLALGIFFIWGTFHLSNALGSSASAPLATPTPQSIIEQPMSPSSNPTKRASNGLGVKNMPAVRATPRPRPSRRPRPSPTPNIPPKVIVTASEGETKGATSFSAKSIPLVGGFPQLWCRVRNDALPTIGSITFTWDKGAPTASPFQYAVQRQLGTFTDGYLRGGGLNVPGNKYRCVATVNGVVIGVVSFTITP